MMWRPIETAPKDERSVICYDPSIGVFIGIQGDDSGRPYWNADWDDQFTMINPTHWMPLPQPPETAP